MARTRALPGSWVQEAERQTGVDLRDVTASVKPPPTAERFVNAQRGRRGRTFLPRPNGPGQQMNPGPAKPRRGKVYEDQYPEFLPNGARLRTVVSGTADEKRSVGKGRTVAPTPGAYYSDGTFVAASRMPQNPTARPGYQMNPGKPRR